MLFIKAWAGLRKPARDGKHPRTSDIGELVLSAVLKEQKEGMSSEPREREREERALIKAEAFGQDTASPRQPGREEAKETKTQLHCPPSLTSHHVAKLQGPPFTA